MIPNQKVVRLAIIEIISKSPLMQLATTVKNRPRVVNVWFSYDGKLNLYYISKKKRLHSKDIGVQSKVAGSIINPRFTVPGRAVRGVTFQGTAKEVPKNKLKEAYGYYQKRYPNIVENVDLRGMVSGRSDMRIYKITPGIYMLFDEVDFFEKPIQHMKLRA